MSPDSVVLEIFFAKFPFEDAKLQDAWQEIDEQKFDPQLRRQLAENGFRVGLVQGPVPSAVQDLLTGARQPKSAAETEQDQEATPSSSLEATIVKLEDDSPVTKRQLQIRAGQRSEVLASSVYESLPLLETEGGQLRGRPYAKGQGLFSIKSYPQNDGRVRLDLLPELHHGDPKVSYSGNQGMIRLETGRAKKVFDHLALTVTLSPGEMIVMSSLPSRPGSLGHYFFTDQPQGKLEQKLLIVRLAQTQHDDLFGPELVAPVDE